MTLRDRLRIIIFEADTAAGRRFDVALVVVATADQQRLEVLQSTLLFSGCIW